MPKSRIDIVDLTLEKPYLSIGEVAAKFQVSPDLLRKWENTFPKYIKPSRTSGSTRLYDQKTVHKIGVIYKLLRIEGLSIDGVKRRLSSTDSEVLENRQEVIQRLQSLRQHLLCIIAELDERIVRINI